MPKTISPYKLFDFGDVRIIKCSDEVLSQEYTPDGWSNFRFFRTTKQTLTNCIAELYAGGYAYMGRDPFDRGVFYYYEAGLDA